MALDGVTLVELHDSNGEFGETVVAISRKTLTENGKGHLKPTEPTGDLSRMQEVYKSRLLQ